MRKIVFRKAQSFLNLRYRFLIAATAE